MYTSTPPMESIAAAFATDGPRLSLAARMRVAERIHTILNTTRSVAQMTAAAWYAVHPFAVARGWQVSREALRVAAARLPWRTTAPEPDAQLLVGHIGSSLEELTTAPELPDRRPGLAVHTLAGDRAADAAATGSIAHPHLVAALVTGRDSAWAGIDNFAGSGGCDHGGQELADRLIARLADHARRLDLLVRPGDADGDLYDLNSGPAADAALVARAHVDLGGANMPLSEAIRRIAGRATAADAAKKYDGLANFSTPEQAMAAADAVLAVRGRQPAGFPDRARQATSAPALPRPAVQAAAPALKGPQR